MYMSQHIEVKLERFLFPSICITKDDIAGLCGGQSKYRAEKRRIRFFLFFCMDVYYSCGLFKEVYVHTECSYKIQMLSI